MERTPPSTPTPLTTEALLAGLALAAVVPAMVLALSFPTVTAAVLATLATVAVLVRYGAALRRAGRALALTRSEPPTTTGSER